MDIDYNTKCYTFEELTFDKGVLDETVDCTYIIHLLDNGRIEHVYSEISRIPTTKKVIIACNKGYKKCDKKLIDQAPYQDLTDAFLQCMKHAKAHQFKNILVMEDDFIFDDKLKDPSHAQNIHRFIGEKSKQNEAFIYYLGAIPLVVYPTTDWNTYKTIKSLTAHSIIYSEQFVKNYEQLPLKKHWDFDIVSNLPNKYIYYTPLCYQPFPETENKQIWIDKHKSILLEYVQNKFIQLFQMDKDPVNGFHFIYFLSKTCCIAVMLIVLFLVLFVLFLLKQAKPLKPLKSAKSVKIKYIQKK